MAARNSVLAVVAVLTTALAPGAAAGVVDPEAHLAVAFTASGTLPLFPCSSCSGGSFSGSGHGTGGGVFLRGSNVYAFDVAFADGVVSGSVAYTEPAGAFCPAFGAASGLVTLSAPATGTVTTPASTAVGAVTRIRVTTPYRYSRDGLGTVMLLGGGQLWVDYIMPGIGSASATYYVSSASAAAGAFAPDPSQAALDCLSPGPLGFTIAGAASLYLTKLSIA